MEARKTGEYTISIKRRPNNMKEADKLICELCDNLTKLKTVCENRSQTEFPHGLVRKIAAGISRLREAVDDIAVPEEFLEHVVATGDVHGYFAAKAQEYSEACEAYALKRSTFSRFADMLDETAEGRE